MRENTVRHGSRLALAVAALLALFQGGCGAPAPNVFSEMVDEFLEGYFAAHPVTATAIGAHRHDHALDDLSEEAVAAEIQRLREFETRRAALPADDLDHNDRIDLEVLGEKIEAELLELEEIQSWKHDPLVYTQTVGSGIHLLLARDFAPLEERLEDAASRLEAVPRLLEQAKQNLDNPPRIHTETAIRQNQGNIRLIREDLARAAAGHPALQARIEEASGPALEALQGFQTFLEDDLLPRSEGDFRLGHNLFRRKLALTLQSNLPPEEIQRRAWAEFFRVREEMAALARGLYEEYFPGSRIREGDSHFEQVMVGKVLNRIADDHPTEDNVLPFIRETLSRLESFIGENDLLTLDKSQTLEVTWMPEFSRGVAIAGLESPGPLETGALKAFYYVMPIPEEWSDREAESFFREYNDHMVQILTIHEAMPGHFVQIYHANRHPSVVRQVFGSGTFIEGWAVYCERMMTEAGYMDHDPRLKLQQLKFYLRTVVNAILDWEIHAVQMNEAGALDLMINGGYQEPSEAQGKWTRARLTSTQLSTYFVGIQDVLDLRDKYREARGDEFTLKEFHGALLAHGSLAPKYMERVLIQP